MWTVRGAFSPTSAFDSLMERLFATKQALAGRIEGEDDERLSAEFDALETQTSFPEFELVAEDGARQGFGFLYVDATHAGFRIV